MAKIFLLVCLLLLPAFVYWQYSLYKEVPKVKEYSVELKGLCKTSATCQTGTFCQPIVLKQEGTKGDIAFKANQEFSLCVPYVYKTFQTLGL